MLGICQATPLPLMWKCTYWPLTSYRDNNRSNQLSPPWKLIGMNHSTLWPMVSFINIWSPLKWFLSLFWNFADCLYRKKEKYLPISFHCKVAIRQLLWYSWASSWDYGTYHVGDQRTLRRAVSPVHLLFAHMEYGSRQMVRPNIRHLAQLDGCACVFEEWVYGGR